MKLYPNIYDEVIFMFKVTTNAFDKSCMLWFMFAVPGVFDQTKAWYLFICADKPKPDASTIHRAHGNVLT